MHHVLCQAMELSLSHRSVAVPCSRRCCDSEQLHVTLPLPLLCPGMCREGAPALSSGSAQPCPCPSALQGISKGLGLPLAASSPPAETHGLCLELTALNSLKCMKNKWLFCDRTEFFSLPFPVPYVGILSLNVFCSAHQ